MGVWGASKVSSLAKEHVRRVLPIGVVLIFISLELRAAPEAEPWPRWQAHQSESRLPVDHTPWSDILARYLVTTTPDRIHLFKYAEVSSKDQEKLMQYILMLQDVPVTRLSRAQQLPYWINLYNAFTVHLVLEHYPLDSIVDIRFGFFDFGPWDEKLLRIEGEKVSLNDVS